MRTGIPHKDERDGELSRLITDAERAWTSARGPLMPQPLGFPSLSRQQGDQATSTRTARMTLSLEGLCFNLGAS